MKSEFSKSHYDTTYTLTDKDRERGEIRVDSYFVAYVWGLGLRDKGSGVLFHILKTLQRVGLKKTNSLQREVDAIHASADRIVDFVDDPQEVIC